MGIKNIIKSQCATSTLWCKPNDFLLEFDSTLQTCTVPHVMLCDSPIYKPISKRVSNQNMACKRALTKLCTLLDSVHSLAKWPQFPQWQNFNLFFPPQFPVITFSVISKFTCPSVCHLCVAYVEPRCFTLTRLSHIRIGSEWNFCYFSSSSWWHDNKKRKWYSHCTSW